MNMMTRSEREDLQRLVRPREKVLKSAAKQRSSELVADFENQLGQEYSFDQDEIWRQAAEAAKREVKKAQTIVSARCRELGIPNRFAPSLNLVWSARGYDNSVDRRKAELRRMAQTQIEAVERKAVTEMDLSCLKAQEQIAVAGLSSDAARQFIDALPSIERLMPVLSFAEVSGESKPPIAEQLVSSNALRQRRFRDRQRNVTGPLQPDRVTLPHSDGDAAPDDDNGEAVGRRQDPD